jgi:hypothetical protein
MRRILVERVRAHSADEQDGSWRRIDLEFTGIFLDTVAGKLVELDEALTQFRCEEPGEARLVEFRFFLVDLPVVGSNFEAIRNDAVFFCQLGGMSSSRYGRPSLSAGIIGNEEAHRG